MIFLLAVAPVFLARPAAAAAPVIVYVSPTGSDTTGSGSSSSPYATISHAVASAPPAATVLVAPGVYNEMVNITQQVTLKSQSMQPSNTIINAAGLSMGVMVNGASAAGTVIEGFTVENANNHGIYAQDTSKVIIEDNVVTNNGLNPTKAFSGEDKAIELVGTSLSSVIANYVVGNQYGGVALNDDGTIDPGFYSGSPNPSLGNIISGNTVVGNRPNHCAVVISAYNANEGVLNNVVSNNIIDDNSAGVIVAADVPNSSATNNTVAFNTITNNGEGGVVIHSNGAGDVVKNTIVMGNTISGNGGAAGNAIVPKFPGIIVGGEDVKDNVAPQNTTIINNVFHNEYYGVYVVNQTSTTILSNTMDSTVSVPLSGASVSTNPVSEQLSSLQSALNQLQSSAAKASDLSSVSGTVSNLGSTVGGLQSSMAKQTDVDTLSGSITTTAYVAYAALVVAVLLGIVSIAIARRRPSAK